ncbi:MAG TPA: YaaA family protein, partial [Candidatus Gracilibacteria bacterium]|nr:YaaA family protein [Candidatus Gracilibacteria bacterium]
KTMKISPALAKKTHDLIADWTTEPKRQSLAIDSFIGDIYSGLRADKLSPADRDYADRTLRILSGLYGIIRPYDGIYPYRLEMEYKLPDPEFSNLYKYWGKAIADCIPEKGPIVNLASEEYTQTITPFVDASRIISPKFLTVSPKTGEPAFVVVHAKIARGAFARWLITSRTEDFKALTQFHDLGYRFHQKLSTPDCPVFVCDTFGGKGLSMKRKLREK